MRCGSRLLVGAFVVLAITGCNGGGGRAFSLSGVWNWVIYASDCPVLDGILNSNQVFGLLQTDNSVSGDFTDSNGSQVTIDGSYRPGSDNFQADLVLTFGNRTIVAFLDLVARQRNNLRTLDGVLTVLSDTEGVCAGARSGVWMTSDVTQQDIFAQCGAVDIVFMMDTSGSMDDEAAALCAQIDDVLAGLQGLGLTDIRVFKWGITEDADDEPEFACLTDNVKAIFGDPIVPGTIDRRLNLEDSEEDWGPGTAIVAELGSNGSTQNFQWRPGAIKILIPISDEGPDDGDPADTQADTDSITNAIAFASDRGVRVSPIIAAGAEVATSEHGRNLANGTGGIATRSTDPNLDLGQIIFDIVFVACGGTIQPPPPPSDPGPTILVAANADGGIYTLDPSTGQDTFLVDTPILVLGNGLLTNVSSMIFNEKTQQVWAGTGGRSACPGCIFTIDPTGVANELIDNSETTEDIPGMTQRRSDQSVFAMDEDDDIQAVNNMTGDMAKFADDLEGLAEQGKAVTFVNDAFYLVDAQNLYSLDTFSGAPTLVAPLTLNGFPPGEVTANFTVISMTTRPSDNTVFGLLFPGISIDTIRNAAVVSAAPIYLCTIDVSNGTVTNIGETTNRLDGLTWVPANYFTPGG